MTTTASGSTAQDHALPTDRQRLVAALRPGGVLTLAEGGIHPGPATARGA
jgi:hypothetical protein